VDHRLRGDADLGNGAFKTWANSIFVWNYEVPDLDKMINKVPPVAAKATPNVPYSDSPTCRSPAPAC